MLEDHYRTALVRILRKKQAKRPTQGPAVKPSQENVINLWMRSGAASPPSAGNPPRRGSDPRSLQKPHPRRAARPDTAAPKSFRFFGAKLAMPAPRELPPGLRLRDGLVPRELVHKR